jgi:hypothetical protein
MRNCCGYTVARDDFGPTPMISSLNIQPER